MFAGRPGDGVARRRGRLAQSRLRRRRPLGCKGLGSPKSVDLDTGMNRQKDLLRIAKDVTETGNKHVVSFGERPGRSEPLV